MGTQMSFVLRPATNFSGPYSLGEAWDQPPLQTPHPSSSSLPSWTCSAVLVLPPPNPPSPPPSPAQPSPSPWPSARAFEPQTCRVSCCQRGWGGGLFRGREPRALRHPALPDLQAQLSCACARAGGQCPDREQGPWLETSGGAAPSLHSLQLRGTC